MQKFTVERPSEQYVFHRTLEKKLKRYLDEPERQFLLSRTPFKDPPIHFEFSFIRGSRPISYVTCYGDPLEREAFFSRERIRGFQSLLSDYAPSCLVSMQDFRRRTVGFVVHFNGVPYDVQFAIFDPANGHQEQPKRPTVHLRGPQFDLTSCDKFKESMARYKTVYEMLLHALVVEARFNKGIEASERQHTIVFRDEQPQIVDEFLGKTPTIMGSPAIYAGLN
jgi:hypothetical protein